LRELTGDRLLDALLKQIQAATGRMFG